MPTSFPLTLYVSDFTSSARLLLGLLACDNIVTERDDGHA
jgi:hypothetical protein